MKRARIFCVVMILHILLVGCATRPQNLYEWGGYQDQIYNMYNDPGKSPPEEQLAKLEEDYQKARSKNRPVPPGYHAHLGYLYFTIGKDDQAVQELKTEKELFPESAVYMDGLLERVGSQKNRSRQTPAHNGSTPQTTLRKK